MTDPKSNANLLAAMAARIRYTPDLLDESCRQAAERIDTLNEATLATLAGPQRMSPEQASLLLKTFPPNRPMPKVDDDA